MLIKLPNLRRLLLYSFLRAGVRAFIIVANITNTSCRDVLCASFALRMSHKDVEAIGTIEQVPVAYGTADFMA